MGTLDAENWQAEHACARVKSHMYMCPCNCRTRSTHAFQCNYVAHSKKRNRFFIATLEGLHGHEAMFPLSSLLISLY